MHRLVVMPGMRGLSDQLYRAVCSVSANIAEGYSRGSGRERAHFYEYALGSARESRDWYFKSRKALGLPLAEHRMDLMTRIIRLLLTTIPYQRQVSLKEDHASYLSHDATTSSGESMPSADGGDS